MIERVLILGLIGIVLINEVASVVDNEKNGFIVLARPNDNQPNEMGPNDYVNENLDDLGPKPKIVDPESEYDPSLHAIFVTDRNVETPEPYGIIGTRVGVGSEEQNFAEEKPKQTEKVEPRPTVASIVCPKMFRVCNTSRKNLNNQYFQQAQPGYICQFALCKKIREALTSARKEVDNTYAPLANAAKSFHEAKMKFLQSLPTAGFKFLQSLMDRDERIND